MNDIQNQVRSAATRMKSAYRIGAPLIFVISAIIAILAFKLSYNAETGYLDGSFWARLLGATVIIELGALAIVVFSAKSLPSADRSGTAAKIITLLLHIAVLCSSAMAIFRENGAIFSLGGNVVTVIKTVLLVCAAVAFMTNSAICKPRDELDLLSVVNSCSTVLLCLSAIALLYFDLSVEMNNPQKLYLQASAASVCLSSLFDLKSRLNGKGEKLSRFFRLLSIALSPIAAASAIFAFSSGEKFFSQFYLFLAIALTAYAISFVCNAIIYKEEK